MHIRACVDPLTATLPALDARRRVQRLPHLRAHTRSRVCLHRRQFKPAGESQCADHHLGWTLDPAEAHSLILEEVGVEHHPQHRRDVVTRIEVGLRHDVDGFGVFGVFVGPLRDRRFVSDEEVIQVARDEARGGFLLADYVHHILAVEVAPLAEEELVIVVMVIFIVVELPRDVSVRTGCVVAHLDGHVVRVDHAPASERPSALLDVLFGVVAHSHREEFQNFSAEVLVDRSLVIILIVQPHQHSGVARQVHQQVAEVAHAVFAEHLHLVHDHTRLNELGGGGREYTVP